MTDPTDVDLYVDPACPWAWLTSRWAVQVAELRPLRLRHRLLSLAEVNRERYQASGDERRLARAAQQTRINRLLVEARRELGDTGLERLYAALGEAWHERGEPLDDASVIARCLDAAGLDPQAAERALDDPTTLDELLGEHRGAVELGAFGVPTLRVGGGSALFGPVVDRRLDPGEALALWDRVSWMLGQSFFFELKRERTAAPQVGRNLVAPAPGS